MIKKFLFSMLIVFSICGFANAETWTLNDILEATCRVRAGGAYGSGTCIHHENGLYYILTNAHVVGNSQSAYLEFFKLGRKTVPLPGTVVFRKLVNQSELDFAIVTVKDSYFGDYPPKIAVLAPRDVQILGNYIKSAGCPSARWPVAWEGTILEQKTGRILFYPPPIGGQSGSGLYVIGKDAEGNKQTYLKGVVTWRIGTNLETKDSRGYESAQGGAVLIDRLIASLNGEISQDKITVPDNYIPVSTTVSGRQIPKDWQDTYALASDGQYYPIYEDPDGFKARNPSGTRIIRWGVQCPDGTCPPRLLPIPDRNTPNPTPGNPYDNLPDFDNLPSPSPEFDEPAPNRDKELRDKIEALQKELESVKEEKSNLEHDILVLNKEIEDFKKKLNDSTITNNQLQAQVEDLQKQIAELKSTLDNKQKEVDQLKELNNSNVTDLQAVINGLNRDLDVVTSQLEDKEQVIKEQSDTIESKEDVIQEVSENETWWKWFSVVLPSGVGIGGVLIWLVRKFIEFKPLTKLENRLDPEQDKIQAIVEKILGEKAAQELRDKVEEAEEDGIAKIKRAVEQMLDEYEKKNLTSPVVAGIDKDTLDDRIAGTNAAIEESNDDLSDKINNIDKSMEERLKLFAESLKKPEIVEKTETPVSYNSSSETLAEGSTANVEDNKTLENDTTSTANTTINNNITVNNKTARKQNRKVSAGIRHFRQIMKIKAKDGENPEYYAILGYLYRQAIEQLRKGKLYYKGETRLLGQEKTAKLITEWVQQEFSTQHQAGKYDDLEDLELEALRGYLYKEAVKKLKEGYFNTLGAEDTANEIGKWINKRYTEYVGINIS